MEIYVYDTYVKARDNHTMHFDVITEKRDSDKAVEFAKKWLVSVGEKDVIVTLAECQFCHSQNSIGPVEQSIKRKGFFIQKMEGCL